MGTTVDVEGGSVRVSNPRLQATFVYDNSVWQSVKGTEGSQYLLVDVDPSGFDRPKTSWLDVAIDGSPLDADAHAATGDAEVASGSVAIPVPVAGADAATVRWRDEAAWTVPPDIVESFATAPRFVVRSATYEEGTGVVVTVANEGDRDGTFRLLLSPSNAHDISSIATAEVAAGAETTLQVSAEDVAGLTPTEGIEVDLHWGTGGSTVVVEATPTGDA